MKIEFSIWNILYTKGLRKGLTLKQLHISIYSKSFKKILRIRIPFRIIGYNRKYADYVHRISEEIRNDYEKK